MMPADDPDFVNSNRLTDNVRLPPLEGQCVLIW
jgi:hypothetical protein